MTLLLIPWGTFAQFELDWPEIPTTWRGLKESVEISGSINSRLTFYSASQNFARRPGFNFNVYGRPTFSVNGLYIPVDFSLGTYQSRLRQNFNRLGISPEYKWVKLHFGNTSVNYSPLALSGHRFLGMGVELTPGKLRFGFNWGRFNRKIDPSDFQGNATVIPQYTRKGFGIKLGYGTDRSYVDLIIFKAKDDSNSINRLNPALRTTPAENAVVAVSVKQTLTERLLFHFDLGFSAYTNDITASTYSGGVFSPVKIPGLLLKERTTTQYLMALQTNMAYKLNDFKFSIREKEIDVTNVLLKLSFDRIEPDYMSMGTYFFKNDVQQLKLSAAFKVLNQKLSVRFPLGFEWNNVLNTKQTNNRRIISGLYMNYIHSKDMIFNFSFSNFSTKLTRDVAPTLDTLLVNQVNRQLGLRTMYKFMYNEKEHTSTVMLNYMSGMNINELTKTKTLSSVTFCLSDQFDIDWQELTLNAGISMNRYVLPFFTTTRIIPGIGARRNFMNNKLHAGYNLSLVLTSVKNGTGNFGISNSVSASMQTFKKQNLSLNFYFLQNLGQNRSFSELMGEFRYRIIL
ncbi:hypothetical protein [Saccharicrinis sp. FJH54]|uniref:hypothetical protein n=1 Tax=Saccharicrinis sp. FJH54 TaxID=3344665 RepID=UPI0035D40204